jgi:hypothetical protein
MRKSLDAISNDPDIFENEDITVLSNLSSTITSAIDGYLHFVDEGRIAPSQWELNDILGDISMRLIPIISDSTKELDEMGITLLTSEGITLAQKLVLVLISTK